MAIKKTPPAIKKTPTEDQEQAALVRWFQTSYPAIKNRLFAIPNGAHKSKQAASRFMATGLRAGVPDLFLPVAHGGYHGLFVEMKRAKGGVVSADQEDWLRYLNGAGYKAVVCRGRNEAMDVITIYLSGKS